MSDPNDRIVAPLLSAHRGVPSTDEANQLVVAFSENQRGEISTQPHMSSLNNGGGKPGQGYPAVIADTIVRRLTPTECERLQGFPDGHTEGQSDAQRYRQMGNAVAVPVVEWIARRLIEVDGSL